MYRLRIRFGRGPRLKFISHLDLMRLWERAFRRADIPLVYSEGFNPHPRLSLAAPLSVGVSSSAELMDVFLRSRVSSPFFLKAVGRQLPQDIELLEVQAVPFDLPSLQSQVSYAEYQVEVDSNKPAKEVEAALERLLALEHLPWQHHRDTGPRHYDLRPLIDELWLVECRSDCCVLGMRLRCGSQGAGRPEQVAAALDFPPPHRSIQRTRLIMGGQR